MFKIPTNIFLSLLLFAAACGSGEDSNAHSSAASAQKLTPDGMAVFRQKCVTCHGADGTLGLNGAKDLSKSVLSLEERINIITHGKNLMTPFEKMLTPEEIQAVAQYTTTLRTQQ